MNYLALLGWAPEDGREVMDDRRRSSPRSTSTGVTHAAAALRPRQARLDERRVDPPPPVARDRGAGDADRADSLRRTARRRPLPRGAALGQERRSRSPTCVAQAAFLFVADDEFAIPTESWERRRRARTAIVEVLDAVIAHRRDMRVERRCRSSEMREC